MRISAGWYRRHRDRFAPRGARHSVVQLRHYTGKYLSVGDGDPLVVVPGLAGGHALTGRLVRVLARQFRVICFPIRGEHDALVARRPHTLGDLAEDLREFLDALLLERPVVVGVSFGSAIALELALRYPRVPSALVLNGLEPRCRDSLGGRIARQALEDYPLPHNSPFFNQFFRLLFARREAAQPLLDYVTGRCWQTDQSVIAERLRLLAAFDARERLGGVLAPTLVVAGADDAVVAARRQELLAAAIPHAEFVALAGAGHLCFLTRPRAFAHHVSRFLATGERLAAQGARG